MHESAVTQGILDVVVKAAQSHGGRRVRAIDLVIGDLSSIVDDSVQFYFDFLSKGTLAEGATLHFQRRAATVLCLDCLHTYQAANPLAPACPRCGSARLQVTGGREFYVDSIEVDDEGSSGTADPERERPDRG